LTAKRADGQKAKAFRFPIPQILKNDEHAWQTDSEFARENLAGFNPIHIKLVTEFPIKSKRGPEFGDPTSAITAEHIEDKLEGRTVEQALAEKKLFTLNHHDTFLPWVERINAQPNSKIYASRVLFFLSADETLKVVAIELVLPPMKGADKVSRVFTPPTDTSKTNYVWEFAKSHAMSNEMTMHQSVSHFTLCHAVTEPAIIASHRHLSKLHPMMQLLFPHFRHTLTTNSTARMNLLPTDGTIELIYTPRKYVVRIASAYYRDNWTFEANALPKDLIKRGMAEPDDSAKHGVKLAIEDYPYASDGLELWGAMKSWNAEYIDIFYEDDKQVQEDPELQAWWKEYRHVGHGDKKDAEGWPELDSKASLAEIVTTIVWICTAMHAPINFGQYDYASWMPQHPAITRRLIPEEGTKEWAEMQANPEKFWLTLISDTDTTTTAMAVFEVVAAHAPNEEYITQRSSGWTENEKVKDAFKRYQAKLLEFDQLIQARNADPNLKNRCGVGNFPFQLLRPNSPPGVTGMGVPNSITV
jgi:lipoxygenase